jgi:hypothetical protein
VAGLGGGLCVNVRNTPHRRHLQLGLQEQVTSRKAAGAVQQRPSNAKALVPLSLSTLASRASSPSNKRNRIRATPSPRIPPSPYLEVRDRERVPVLGGLVLFPSPAEGPEGLKLWTGTGMCAQTCARAVFAHGTKAKKRGLSH